MNKHVFLYADVASRTILENDLDKLILIGSDFGYGNFGDILQHANSINLAKKSQRFSTIAVLSTYAIGSSRFPDWARHAYGADAIMFVSDHPLILGAEDPALELVRTIRNPSIVHLYGGGFLNDKWGDFVLGITEFFLRSLPGVTYLISGQQITHPYEIRVLQHIKEFKPAMFGVRDELSRHWLSQAGFQPSFSFDDATESIISLSEKMQLRRASGVLLHMNTSGYTSDDGCTTPIGDELERLASHASVKHGVTVLQAYMDPRHEVKDSRESIKLLDCQFPFLDYRTIELAPLAYRCFDNTLNMHLSGDIGCSSSYHIALWLQLSGIPCWLRSRNPYYDQKSKALQVHQDFESFLEHPHLADHQNNLENRAQWLERLNDFYIHAPSVKLDFTLDFFERESQSRHFYSRALPFQEERTPLEPKQDQLLKERLAAVNEQLTELGHYAHAQRQRAEAAELKQFEASDRLTELGNYAHAQRQRAEAAEQKILAAEQRRIGLYEIARELGRRCPIPAGTRSRIGRLLLKFRRKG